MVYVTRRETFNAAHRLYNPNYSDEENLKIFGKCSNPNWHGHNYVLEVIVKGKVDESTGFVINQKDLKKIIREKVIDKMDHKNLNIETDFMQGVIATSENIVVAIWEQLVTEIKPGKLYSVNFYETENHYLEYRV